MTDNQREWERIKDQLVSAVKQLGFPEELGEQIAKQLGKAVKCDIAIVPIGGTYTVDAKKAAELVNTIRPDIAVPVYYGSFVGKPSDGEVFALNVKSPVKVIIKIQF